MLMVRKGVLVGALLASLSTPCLAAPARVQGAQNVVSGAGLTISITLGATIGSGNMLCLFGIFKGNAGATFAFSDDKSNPGYTTVDVANSTNDYGVSGYILNMPNNGPQTITMTVTGAGATAVGLIVDEFSGVATSAAIDGHNKQAQTAPTTATDAVSSGPFTTTANGDLICGGSWGSQAGAPNVAIGTGFTLATSGGANWQSEYRVQGSSGAIAATYTASTNQETETTGMAFKAAAGGGGGGKSPSRGLMMGVQ